MRGSVLGSLLSLDEGDLLIEAALGEALLELLEEALAVVHVGVDAEEKLVVVHAVRDRDRDSTHHLVPAEHVDGEEGGGEERLPGVTDGELDLERADETAGDRRGPGSGDAQEGPIDANEDHPDRGRDDEAIRSGLIEISRRDLIDPVPDALKSHRGGGRRRVGRRHAGRSHPLLLHEHGALGPPMVRRG